MALTSLSVIPYIADTTTRHRSFRDFMTPATTINPLTGSINRLFKASLITPLSLCRISFPRAVAMASASNTSLDNTVAESAHP